MVKRFVSIAITACLVFTGFFGCFEGASFTGVNLAYADTTSDGLVYAVQSDGTVKITDYVGTKSDVIIPSQIGGRTVASMSSYAFNGCTTLKSVTIPSTISNISVGAFYGCSALTEVTMHYGVMSIDEWAFYNCSSLKEIQIPVSVSIIEENAFYNSGVKCIYGGRASYAKTFAQLKGIDFIEYAVNDDGTSVTITKYIGNSSSLTIPAQIESKKVTAIGSFSFNNCNSLKSVTITNGIKTIEDNAFAWCADLSNVSIPYSVTSIGDGAFKECMNLTSITLSSNVTSIGNYVFYNSGLRLIYGYSGSYAQQYAKANNIEFKALDQNEVIATGVTTNSLNVRTGPSTSYTSIGKLASGAKVDIVARDSATGWYKIKYNGGYGYVSDKYLKVTYNNNNEVIATGTTTNSLNVRKGASTSYSILGKLASGTKVEIVEKLSNGWYKIKYNGDYGYVSGQYVKLNSDTPTPPTPSEEVIATGTTTNSLNVRKGASTSYSILGKLASGTKVEIVEKLSNGWYKIKYNGGYGYVSGVYVKLDGDTPTPPTPSEEVIATGTTTSSLNVRTGPSTSYASIGKLASGAKVEIVAQDSATAWFKIKYNGGYGYVSYKYVKVNSSSEVIATGTTTGTLNVRKGPSTSYTSIGKLASGAKVEIVAQDSATSWYKIKYNGGYGYVSNKYIKLA